MQKYRLTISLVILLAVGFSASAQVDPNSYYLATIQADTIPVTQSKITCILFPVSIQPAGKGTRDIRAQKVKGTDNVIMVQATRANFPSTNLTVVGTNGHLYSLILRYESDPSVFNYQILDDNVNPNHLDINRVAHPVLISGLPVDESTLAVEGDSIGKKTSFLHYSQRSERMRLKLNSFYIKDGLIWMTIDVKNSSLLDYKASFFHLSVQDVKQAKRTALQERNLPPIFQSADKLVPGKQSRKIVFAFRPFTVPKHKRLRLQLSEEYGGRMLTLEIGYKAVLRARSAE